MSDEIIKHKQIAQCDIEIVYRDIPNWPHYRACTDGTIWSRKRKGGNDRSAGKIGDTWRKLSECANKNGYSCVNLFKDRRSYIIPVSYLILETFIGPRPDGYQACHFPDNNRRNNRLDNLRWDTPSSNQQDRKFHGTVTRNIGELNPLAKLTKSDVLEVIRRRKNGEIYRVIAETFGVTSSLICDICNGKAWVHITGGPVEKCHAKQ